MHFDHEKKNIEKYSDLRWNSWANGHILTPTLNKFGIVPFQIQRIIQ